MQCSSTLGSVVHGSIAIAYVATCCNVATCCRSLRSDVRAAVLTVGIMLEPNKNHHVLHRVAVYNDTGCMYEVTWATCCNVATCCMVLNLDHRVTVENILGIFLDVHFR